MFSEYVQDNFGRHHLGHLIAAALIGFEMFMAVGVPLAAPASAIPQEISTSQERLAKAEFFIDPRSQNPSETPTSSAANRQNFSWPLRPAPRVIAPFLPPSTMYGRGHRGVDLEAVMGQEVLAANDGTVIFAGTIVDRNVISIEHANGLRTTYEPVLPIVHNGETVHRGQLIGSVLPAHPGCFVPACLHWGVKRSSDKASDPDAYFNPLDLLTGLSPIRLKPWEE